MYRIVVDLVLAKLQKFIEVDNWQVNNYVSKWMHVLQEHFPRHEDLEATVAS